MNEEKALILGREKIGKLLLQYALPAIIAQIAASLYNVVDRIFIGQGVGPLAISGLALTFPFMNLTAAFGTLVGVGASTLTSIRLGEKNYDSARLVLGNLIILNITIGLFITIICLPFLNDILYALGGSEDTIVYAKDYMRVILLGNVFTHLYFGLNAILRSSGYPAKAMFVTVFSVGLNAVLDALFIFVFKWGIAGAAWATVLTQFVSFLVLLFLLLKRNQVVFIKKEYLKFKPKISKAIFSIGLSPFMTNLIACLVVVFLNFGFKKYGGDLAIGAYGIVNSVAFMFVMIVLGLTQGMQPIIGYNYGAKRYGRVISTLNKALLSGFIITTIGFLTAELFPEFLALAFSNNEELVDKSVKGFRIFMSAFPFVGLQIVSSNFFQSLGMAKKAVFLSMTRQLIFLLPILLILPKILGLPGVWAASPIADFLSAIVSLSMLYREVRIIKRSVLRK